MGTVLVLKMGTIVAKVWVSLVTILYCVYTGTAKPSWASTVYLSESEFVTGLAFVYTTQGETGPGGWDHTSRDKCVVEKMTVV